MKNLSISELENICASGTGQTIISGVSCGWGLAILLSSPLTLGATSLVGAGLTVAGCGTLIGNW